jgi:hypothetical protein
MWVAGLPSALQDVTQYGYIYEDIWDPGCCYCAIGSYGIIMATRPERKGDELLMNYGDDWGYWDSYKLTVVRTAARLLGEVALALGIGCYKDKCREMVREVNAWQLWVGSSLNHVRAGTSVEEDGAYANLSVLHNMVPGWRGFTVTHLGGLHWSHSVSRRSRHAWLRWQQTPRTLRP